MIKGGKLILLILGLSATLIALRTLQILSSKANESSATLSQSKLGVFIISSSDGAKKIIKGGPKVIKVIDPQYNSGLAELIKTYKSFYPQGKVVARIWTGTSGLKYTKEQNPSEAADNFYQQVLSPAIKNFPTGLRGLIDYISGPNEFENTPFFATGAEVEWTGKFWERLAVLIKQAGFKPCLGDISVANLEVAHLPNLIASLRKIKEAGGAWSYHAYTYTYAKDANAEMDHSLRYRQFYNYFKNNAPDLMSLPMILTEAGVAENGDPHGGYQRSNNSSRYKDWLIWFDQRLKEDSFILGSNIFQIGNTSDWSVFNIEPLSDWFSSYLDGTPIVRISVTSKPFPTSIAHPSPKKTIEVTIKPTIIPKVLITTKPTIIPKVTTFDNNVEPTFLKIGKENQREITKKPEIINKGIANKYKLDLAPFWRNLYSKVIYFWENYLP